MMSNQLMELVALWKEKNRTITYDMMEYWTYVQ